MFLNVFSCSVMGLVLTSTCVLCTGLLAPTARAAGTLARPLHPTDPVIIEGQEPLETSYLNLPMFLHFRKPRVDKVHFSPTHTKSRKLIPKRVRQILVPEPRRRPKTRVNVSGPMSVSCDWREMRVRVERTNLEAGMHVRLGTCDVSRQTEQSVLFRYELHACGTRKQILNETLVYSNMLHYTPDSSGFGFHYSYKIGYVPSVERLKFLKPIKTKGSVSLTICDAQWNRLPPSQAVIIGRPIHVEAEALYVPEDQRLFLTSCHVTTNSSSVSMPQVNIIDNYGCLIDSKRSSRSRFIGSTRRNVVRFIVDAFSLQGEEQKCNYFLSSAMVRPLMSDLKSLVEQHPEQQKNPVQNPKKIITTEPKHETALRENLLTDIPEQSLPPEHGTVSEHGQITRETPPTRESQNEKLLPETPPTPAIPLSLDSNQSLTPEHKSRTLTPESEPRTKTPEYGTPVPNTEWEMFTPYTHTTVTPSVQQSTVTLVNTHAVLHEPHRIFEEVFGLG
ncbi:Zona pellucida sperm-binding protein 3 [Bagarius yarrelli]|uniref:Zona pellucida sperm-binding protein 3 n=1 Tax=Bagarius yarrelli TaxID=175774 RepID=A0A556VW38_BAGYA|nr:Zona pellucida sperm-binding protein 3 [Bagarius yarrelli]